MALNTESTEPDMDVENNALSVPSSRAMHRYRSVGCICVGLVTHRYSIAVMALSPEGTEPDIDVLDNPLSVQKQQSHAQAQVSRFHLCVGLVTHRCSIVVIALSPEGTEPDMDASCKDLPIPSSRAMHRYRSVGCITCRLKNSQSLHCSHGTEC